jgi:ParB-like chromosome segregation protein Spo0J
VRMPSGPVDRTSACERDGTEWRQRLTEVSAIPIDRAAKSARLTKHYPQVGATVETDGAAFFCDGHRYQCTRTTVSIACLVRTGSPRSGGVDEAHVRRLSEAEGPLPPILVHETTMQVIDGFHRVTAAIRKGLSEVDAYLYHGPIESAFVIAVEANVTHGLPLSLADRRAAAVKILQAYPQWSDRAIATSTGLSAKTVGAIRCATADNQQLHERLGKDGRIRPLNAAAGRQLASELLSRRPNAPLREIAEAAGISTGTVRDVRARLWRGDDPVPARRRRNGSCAGNRGKPNHSPVREAPAPADVQPLMAWLARDPALRMSRDGRELIRWLHVHAVETIDVDQIATSIPGHCFENLIELANRCSANWARIAHDLAVTAERKHSEMAVPSRGGIAADSRFGRSDS